MYFFTMILKKCAPKEFLTNFLANSFEITNYGLVLIDNEWEVGPRVTEDHLIYYLSEGSVNAQIEDENICINPEELFWLQPGPKHYFSLQEGVRRASIFFFRFKSGNTTLSRLEENFLKFKKDPVLKSDLSGIFIESEISPAYRDIFLKSRLSELLCRALSTENSGVSKLEGFDRVKRKKVHNFLLQNIDKNLSLGEMAKSLELNPDYFSRQFKKSFGLSPSAWIKKEKVRLAHAYLSESRMTISQIAYKLGYEDLAFFSRQFKEVTGYAPSQKRQ